MFKELKYMNIWAGNRNCKSYYEILKLKKYNS